MTMFHQKVEFKFAGLNPVRRPKLNFSARQFDIGLKKLRDTSKLQNYLYIALMYGCCSRGNDARNMRFRDIRVGPDS
jgi:hypothetical protein